MAEQQNRFIWYELLTSDAGAARAFYGKVVGWTAKDSGLPGGEYWLLETGNGMVGGLMTLPEDAAKAGMPPRWLGYVSVADVDRAVSKIVADGGASRMPAMDIPTVGRFALVADPQGVAFYLMTPSGEGESNAFSVGTLGHAGWNELHAADGPAAFAFYSKHFGWEMTDEMDMGPMGKYILFNTGSGEAVGGMMTKHSLAPPSWLFYFNVDDITAATTRVGEGGGAVVNGPHEVPGGLWIIQCTDPQGAMFALVSATKS
jgi:predicted enzyme related to lactoylglutathione lyase